MDDSYVQRGSLMFVIIRPGERLRLAIAVACGLIGGFGCMSFNLGNRTYEGPGSYIDRAGALKQNGESPICKTRDDRLEVFYPRPYATTPHLTLCKGSNSIPASEIELLDQHPDHFTVRWKGSGGEAVLAWKAEGMPGAKPEVSASISPAPIPTGPIQAGSP